MRMAFDLIPEQGEGANHIYLETAAVVTTFILAGRYFEATRQAPRGRRADVAARARRQGRRGARRGGERRVPIERLQPGDRFVVRPGEKVATDGVVVEGRSAVDLSLLTGESVPVEVGPGTEVAGATVNAGGRLVVRATKVGADTALAQIAKLVTRRAVRQGAGPAARRPRRERLRPGRDRARRRHARLLARHRRERDVRVHRRRRGADHRLPVRARPGDAGRADGRHRPRRPARPADQGPGGARVHPPRRHDRARQDRHGDERAG